MDEYATITYRDLYIQVKRTKLKHPHVFLSLALRHLSISTFKAFGVSIFVFFVSYGNTQVIPLVLYMQLEEFTKIKWLNLLKHGGKE